MAIHCVITWKWQRGSIHILTKTYHCSWPDFRQPSTSLSRDFFSSFSCQEDIMPGTRSIFRWKKAVKLSCQAALFDATEQPTLPSILLKDRCQRLTLSWEAEDGKWKALTGSHFTHRGGGGSWKWDLDRQIWGIPLWKLHLAGRWDTSVFMCLRNLYTGILYFYIPVNSNIVCNMYDWNAWDI